MSSADRLEDGFPHGTVEGYAHGCRSGYCPAGEEHGLSCRRAKQLAAGDYRFQRLVKQGLAPFEISLELGLMPETHTAPARKRVAVPDDGESDEPEEEVVEQQVMVKSTDLQAPTADDEKRRRAQIRAWAAEHGIHVGAKGRIAQAIVLGWLNDDPPLSGTREASSEARVDEAPKPKPRRKLGSRKPAVQPPALSEPVEHELAGVAEAVTSDDLPVLSPDQREAVVAAIVHGPVLPDMETRAELFNEGFAEAEAQYGPAIDDLLRAEGALELVLTKWAMEQQRRKDAERLAFVLAQQVTALEAQIAASAATKTMAFRQSGDFVRIEGANGVLIRGNRFDGGSAVLHGAHVASRKPWWKRWAS